MRHVDELVADLLYTHSQAEALQAGDADCDCPRDERDRSKTTSWLFAGDAIAATIQPRAVTGVAPVERCHTRSASSRTVRVVHV
jgi:hypothetical protein